MKVNLAEAERAVTFRGRGGLLATQQGNRTDDQEHTGRHDDELDDGVDEGTIGLFTVLGKRKNAPRVCVPW